MQQLQGLFRVIQLSYESLLFGVGGRWFSFDVGRAACARDMQPRVCVRGGGDAEEREGGGERENRTEGGGGNDQYASTTDRNVLSWLHQRVFYVRVRAWS